MKMAGGKTWDAEKCGFSDTDSTPAQENSQWVDEGDAVTPEQSTREPSQDSERSAGRAASIKGFLCTTEVW